MQELQVEVINRHHNPVLVVFNMERPENFSKLPSLYRPLNYVEDVFAIIFREIWLVVRENFDRLYYTQL